MAKSATFWVLAAAGGTAGLCCLSTMGVMMLGLVSEDAPGTSSAPVRTASRLPTGETPDLFPGMPGWLPSGRGVPIPDAEVVDGRPEGLWWIPFTAPSGQAQALTTLFLADGTRATNPRPGGGERFDLEGQRAQRGQTGVGTFALEGSTLKQRYDGFESAGEFDSGDDTAGPWFSIGQARYRPLAPPSAERLVGQWDSGSSRWAFHDDGTYESGSVNDFGDFVVAGTGRGTWALDGYLIAITPADGAGWINRVGMTGDDLLVLGQILYGRK